MLLTETQIATDPALVHALKNASEEKAAPMSPEEFIQHLRDIASRKDNG
jgi:hypothetical protein